MNADSVKRIGEGAADDPDQSIILRGQVPQQVGKVATGAPQDARSENDKGGAARNMNWFPGPLWPPLLQVQVITFRTRWTGLVKSDRGVVNGHFRLWLALSNKAERYPPS